MATIAYSSVKTIGIDLAKNVFQLHGVDDTGEVLFRMKLRRAQLLRFLSDIPACLIGIEACATAHHWARKIGRLGHAVKLIPPAYVKPYVKRGKNDAVDAEAICEAVTRPNMRFVPIKNTEQQSVLMLHRSRDLLIRQRTMLLNAIRGHLAEFGIITAQGPCKMLCLLKGLLTEGNNHQLPDIALTVVQAFMDQLDHLTIEIKQLEKHLMAWHRKNKVSTRLEAIPGVGFLTATALAASTPEPKQFRNGRQFAAFLGLTPRQNSSGGKDKLGRISKMGDRYLRKLLVVGATSVLRRADSNNTTTGAWVRRLREHKPAKLVAVAIANKSARIAWAIMARGKTYKTPIAATPVRA